MRLTLAGVVAEAVAGVAALLIVASPSVLAQATAPATQEAPVSRPAFPGAPNFRRSDVVLPPVPHEAQPEARPYPDYFAEALKHTQVKARDSGQLVQLRLPSGAPRPGIVVLPVQTQAFGLAPAMRAIIGAQLDHELASRRIEASRQTDLATADGPFARRLPDAAIDAFAREQAPSAMLALYLGHDGIDTAFVTLLLRDGSADKARERRVHRSVTLPTQVRPAIEAVHALLPVMLTELGLGTEANSRPQSSIQTCGADAWALSEVETEAPSAARACHALIVGTLLPPLSPPSNLHQANTDTPAKLAWLAEAWVQSRALGANTGTANAIETLAWEQLRLDKTPVRPTTEFLASSDPVVAPLAKMLTAQQRSAVMPVRSAGAAAQRFIAEAAQGLPPFVGGLFVERGNFSDVFHQVDLCVIERNMPGIMLRSACDPNGSAHGQRPTRASAAQVALHQHWRLASYYKDIRYYGKTLGQRSQLARHLNSLPSDIAAHPFVRQGRALAEIDQPSLGSMEDHVARVRAAVQAFVQSTADLQRYDTTLAGQSLSEHHRTSLSNVLSDQQVGQASDDESRLLLVLRFDRFTSSDIPAARRAAGLPAAFLASDPVRAVAYLSVAPNLPAATAPAAVAPPTSTQVPNVGAPQSMPPRQLFPAKPFSAEVRTDEELRASIAARPTDMKARVALAMQMLKQGTSIAQARAVIDDHPPNSRSEDRVTQSHVWSDPGHAFFFAGEIDSAKYYYQRVRGIGTGSESDLQAGARLLLLEGDMAGALAAAGERLRRYEGDYVRRDVAALSFMLGQPERAWAAVQPRLASASTMQLWTAALTGHRREQLDTPGVKDWLTSQGLRRARVQYQAAAPLYLHLHAVIDRLPGEEDIRLFRERDPNRLNEYLNDQWAASATLTRMALQNNFQNADFDPLRRALALSSSDSNKFLQPMFAWAAWHATANQDAELESIRMTQLNDNDFDRLLAKAMLLALDGKNALSQEFLRAARWQMSELGRGHDNVERPVPAPYQYALAGWLMWRKTGQEAYRAEVLRFVRSYQRVMPAWGWLYALEAQVETDPTARATALCRARYLDASSYFLSLAPSVTAAQAAGCRKAMWSSASR